MEKYEINKILDVYHSKDYTEKIIRWRYNDISNSWLQLGKLKEFDFVKDIINKDLQEIDNNYRCAPDRDLNTNRKSYQGSITLLKYVKGDFMDEHCDSANWGTGILSGGYELNDEYKGGNFILDGKKLEVGVGELFTYGRDILHEVKKVTSGIRYSLHFFIDKL